MSIGRVFMILCGMILAVCLVFSVSALTVLRTAVAETDRVRKSAQEMVERLEENEKNASEALPVQGKADETESESEPESSGAETASAGYLLRECNGKIGIFTADGDLIRMEETSVETLPPRDREALQNGIPAKDWREVLSLLQDLGG